MFSSLFEKKMLLISGKGGTGKSTIAAILAILAAQKGKNVLIAESHAFDKLAPIFGKKPAGHEETVVAPGISCINLNAKRCFAEYVSIHLGMESLYKRVFSNQVVSSFLDAIPGLDEAMILGRLFYTCELRKPAKYDLIIFDCPASGHFINLMATPDKIIQTGLVGPLVNELKRTRDFLADRQKCAGIIVTLPEGLAMSETFEFLPIFARKVPVGLDSIIINRDYSYFRKNESLAPAIASYGERKKEESDKSRSALLEALAKSAFKFHIFSVPNCEQIPEPLDATKLGDMLPLFEKLA